MVADIRLDCPEDNYFVKDHMLLGWIRTQPDYDVIIKTNVSTILNLKLLDSFIHSDAFQHDRVYGSQLMWDRRFCGDNYGMFLVGYFLMASRKIWEDAYTVWEETFKDTMNKEVLENLTHGKMDIHGDMLFGPVCSRNGYMPTMLRGLSITPKEVEDWGNKWYDQVASSVCIRCKLALPSGSPEARNTIEPTVLRILGEFYRILPDDYKYLKDLKGSIYNTDWRIPNK